MKIQIGYLYHIKDSFFEKLKDKNLMINHEEGHSRPSYLAIQDKDLLWFIPLSSKVEKYKRIIDRKTKKYGVCKTIMIDKIAGRECAILIQNAFPTLEKYVKCMHKIDGRSIKVSTKLEREILNNFKTILKLKEKGLNLFFCNIDEIKQIMEEDNK